MNVPNGLASNILLVKTASVAATGRSVLVVDVNQDPRYIPGIEGGRCEMAVPLRVRDGGATLRFRGAWKINALTAQLILRDSEDFMFERPYWNMDVDVE